MWSRYQEDGATTITKGKHGRRQVDQRNLPAEQEATINHLIVGMSPIQVKSIFLFGVGELSDFLFCKFNCRNDNRLTKV